MRLNGLGAGTSVFSARYVGLRHDPRNRRPRQPHVHGCQPRRQSSGDPRRGDHRRLHGPRFLEETDPSGRKDADHRHLRPRQPPRLIHQGAVGLLFGEAEDRHAHRAGERHPAAENRRGAIPRRCRRRAAAGLDAQRLLLYLSGAAGAGGDRLREHLETPGPPRTAVRNHERSASDRLSETDRAGKSTSPTSSPPTNPATGPCATRWRS